jgi:hypothetical protein
MSESLDALLERGPVAVNLGIREFAASLSAQGAEVVDVDWSPPAEGDPELLAILEKIL